MQQTEFIVDDTRARSSTRTTRRRRSPSRPSTRSAPGSRRGSSRTSRSSCRTSSPACSRSRTNGRPISGSRSSSNGLRTRNGRRESRTTPRSTSARSSRRSKGRSTKPSGRVFDRSFPTGTIGCCSHASLRRARARNVISGVRIEWAVQRVDRPIASKCRLSGRDRSRRSRGDHHALDIRAPPSSESVYGSGERIHRRRTVAPPTRRTPSRRDGFCIVVVGSLRTELQCSRFLVLSYGPILNDPDYVTDGPTKHDHIVLGALFELLTAAAVAGTALGSTRF